MKTPCLLLCFLVIVLSNSALADTNQTVVLSTTAIAGTAGDDQLQPAVGTNATATLSITTNVSNGILTMATGADGLAGNDQLNGNAPFTAQAQSSLDIGLRYWSAEADAISAGLAGGAGQDSITNNSSIHSTAGASTVIGDFLMQIDVAVTGWPVIADSDALGLDGGANDDTLVNNSNITVSAGSFARVNKGRIATVEIPIDLFGFGNASVTASSTAVGLNAGTNSSTALETAINNGLLLVSATATSTTRQFIAELLGAARVDDTTTAHSLAIGIAGSATNDLVRNTRNIDAGAASESEIRTAEFKMKGLLIKGFFNLFGFDVGKFNTIAESEALGLAGAAGDDLIINSGSNAVVNAHAASEAISTSITLAVKPPFGSAAATADSSSTGLQPVSSTEATSVTATNPAPTATAYGTADTRAKANATATAGGAGSDTILNFAAQSATATAHADSIGVNADVSFSSSSYFPFPGAAIADTASSAEAVSAALDGGSGDDVIVNTARLDSIANAGSDALTVGATIQGSTEGLAAGVTVVDASSEAVAVSHGISGSTGGDSITNTGTINAAAAANAESFGIGVTVAGAKVGMAFGVALGDSSATSRAWACGIDAGDFQETNGPANDTVLNSGNLTASAGATNLALSAFVNITAAMQGVVGGVTATRSDATAEATAIGIQTGNADDTILGAGGSLNTVAAADSASTSVSATFSGALEGASLAASLAKAETRANATSTALDAGSGSNTILNHTAITNRAVAVADSASVAFTFSGAFEGAAIGASLADGRTEATATAAGIIAGDGNDSITNTAAIVNSASADAEAQVVSITAAVAIKGVGIGVSFARGGAEATSDATGISGGDGNDAVVHAGLLDVDSTARAKVNTVAITISHVGAAMAEASSQATATATGIGGGSGTDFLWNEGAVNVFSSSLVDGSGTAATFFGYVSGDVSLTNLATAVGLQGSAASATDTNGDAIFNASGATLNVISSAEILAENHDYQIGGATFADAEARATSSSTGIASGALADGIANYGAISVSATSLVAAANSTFQLGGVVSGEAGIHAVTTAVGIMAGDGQNGVTNASTGNVSSYARAETEATDVSGNAIGVALHRTGSDASVVARGVVTGNGVDTILNFGSIEATGSSDGSAGAAALGLFSMTFAGSLSDAKLEGINSGGANDSIGNWGTITVGALKPGDAAVAKAYTTAFSVDFVSIALTLLGATADARGINGEGGDDFIYNAGAIAVGRADQWLASGTSYGFGGQVVGMANTSALGFGTANAIGIAGGEGADTLINASNGNITVHARAHSDVDTDTYEVFSALFPSGADSAADATATATGIQGGTGNDSVGNAGSITARAHAFADAQTLGTLEVDIATWCFTEASADPTATAYGIDLGSGQNSADDTGSIDSRATANSRAYAHSHAAFEATSTDVSGRPVATATGITAGNDSNTVVNATSGYIRAQAIASTTNGSPTMPDAAAVFANSDDGRDADATSGTPAMPLLAQAAGIVLGAGGDIMTNHGTITAEADTIAWSRANTHVWYRYPTSDAKAYGNAVAQGIAAGEGNNTIVNTGELVANAISDAAPYARAFSRDYGPSSYATGVATASAYGIRGGNGDNFILNDGTIRATANAHTWAYAYAEENAGDIRTERAIALASANSTAWGILAGNGSNTVVNTGWIAVTARASAAADAVTEDGDVRSATATYTASAVGIQTGNGNDHIINAGSILTTNSTSVSSYGTAINSGAGEDTVGLLNNSVASGDVLLGNGNDTLELSGTVAHTGTVNGGNETDTMLLNGAGNLSGSCVNFERLVKSGAGLFSLEHLATMQWMEMQAGALHINDGYQFGSNSTLAVNVGRDGAYGECQIMGAADFDGTLLVRRGRGAYTNTTYDIIEAASMTNRFAQEIVPAPTRLLRFDVNYLTGGEESIVQVQAVANSFTTVANNRLERDIAQYLDRVLPLAQGDFSDVLGEFQMLNAGQYDAAFASFSPAVYDANTVASFSGAREYNRLLAQHLRAGRAALGFAAIHPKAMANHQPLPTRQTRTLNDEARELANGTAAEPAVWVAGFGRWDELSTSEGFPGFNYSVAGTTLGFDYARTDRLLAGAALMYSSARIDLNGNHGTGEAENFGGSLYATRRFERFYLDGALSYERHRYENSRRIQVGAIERIAQSDHDGNACSVLLGGGRKFSAKAFEFEPFASLLYTWLNEDGFQETGADSLNMSVASRDTHSLKSELGLRLSRPIELRKLILVPEISLAWEHDFDVDDRKVTGTFAGAPGTIFSIAGQGLDPESIVAHGGLVVFNRGSFSTGFNYDALLSGGRTTHSVSGQIRISF